MDLAALGPRGSLGHAQGSGKLAQSEVSGQEQGAAVREAGGPQQGGGFGAGLRRGPLPHPQQLSAGSSGAGAAFAVSFSPPRGRAWGGVPAGAALAAALTPRSETRLSCTLVARGASGGWKLGLRGLPLCGQPMGPRNPEGVKPGPPDSPGWSQQLSG